MDTVTSDEHIISFLGVLHAPWMSYERDDRTRWLVQRRGAEKQHKDDAGLRRDGLRGLRLASRPRVHLRNQLGGHPIIADFDSNVMTPGTPWMEELSRCIALMIRKEISENALWRKLKVI